MTRSIGIVLLLLLVSLHVAESKERKFSLGIMLLEPSGLSGKAWLDNTSAVDGAMAWSLARKNSFYLHADYLHHNFTVFNVSRGQLPVYYGIGGRILSGDWGNLAVRIPVGVNYLFADAPLDVFMEVVPVLDLVPATQLEMNGAVGIRYTF